jgi:hypothetical protein
MWSQKEALCPQAFRRTQNSHVAFKILSHEVLTLGREQLLLQEVALLFPMAARIPPGHLGTHVPWNLRESPSHTALHPCPGVLGL